MIHPASVSIIKNPLVDPPSLLRLKFYEAG
jgi:hypothetical protein